MKRFFFFLILGLVCLGCQKAGDDDRPSVTDNSVLYVVNEGSFGSPNASFSLYVPGTDASVSDLLSGAGPEVPCSLAQSMSVSGDCGFLVMNGDGVLVKVSLADFREIARLEGLNSPRYFHLVSESKAYLSQMGSGEILIIDPRTMEISGHMDSGLGSVERFVEKNGYIYANSWSFGNSLIKIDPASDKIVATMKIGEQPNSMAFDSSGFLWVITDGGWNSDFTGRLENPALHKVDVDKFEEVAVLEFPMDASVSELVASPDGKTLYYLDSGVCSFPVSSSALQDTPFIEQASDESFYALTVSPVDGDIYVTDAADYSTPGSVIRYSVSGERKSSFTAGICPGDFCWNIPE